MKSPKSNFTYADFPIRQRVKIIAKVVDFCFWYGETGTVWKNKGGYLGIIVRLDEPRAFNGYIQTQFNFDPDHLKPIKTVMGKWRGQKDILER